MRVILCNIPEKSALSVAKALVEGGFAACVNLLTPVRSVYLWQGELCEESEVPLLIKVAEDRVDALREELVALHPYEVPEVLVLPVDVQASHQPYVDWVRGARGIEST